MTAVEDLWRQLNGAAEELLRRCGEALAWMAGALHGAVRLLLLLFLLGLILG
ncbi:MAG: hypothetical protein KIT81_00575 [Alphaproteobacteria bacterium]|nr:hypothetical protein [Alphaproteobacteria bacterium]